MGGQEGGPGMGHGLRLPRLVRKQSVSLVTYGELQQSVVIAPHAPVRRLKSSLQDWREHFTCRCSLSERGPLFRRPTWRHLCCSEWCYFILFGCGYVFCSAIAMSAHSWRLRACGWRGTATPIPFGARSIIFGAPRKTS